MSSTPLGLARAAAVLWCLFLSLATSASAQYRPSPALDFSAGWVGFADDGIVSETAVGGDGRFYLSPRVAIGPEMLFIGGDDHSHFVLTGNLTFDLIPALSGRPPAVTPFFVVGGGMFQTRESFFGEDFTYAEGAFTVGGGVRAAMSDRITVGVDARVGWEPHIRLSGVVGVRLGR